LYRRSLAVRLWEILIPLTPSIPLSLPQDGTRHIYPFTSFFRPEARIPFLLLLPMVLFAHLSRGFQPFPFPGNFSFSLLFWVAFHVRSDDFPTSSKVLSLFFLLFSLFVGWAAIT